MNAPDGSAAQAVRLWRQLLPARRREQFRRLREGAQQAIDLLQPPCAAQPRQALHDLLPALHADYYVMALGLFSAGKSTLLNALLHRPLLPAKHERCTRRLTRLQYGSTPRATLFNPATGQRQECPLEQIAEFNAQLADHEATGTARSTLEIALPLPLLADLTLLDTPGFDDAGRLDDEHSRHLLAQADCVLWLIPGDRVGKQADVELLSLAPAEARRLGVLTKWDLVQAPIPGDSPEPERQKALAEARRTFPQVQGWFCVDSMAALRALASATPDGDSGVPTLEAELRQSARDGLRHKAAQRRQQITHQIRLAQQHLSDRRERLQAIADRHQEMVEGLFAGALQALCEAIQTISRAHDSQVEAFGRALLQAGPRLLPTRAAPGFEERLHDAVPTDCYQPRASWLTNAWRQLESRLTTQASKLLGYRVTAKPWPRPDHCDTLLWLCLGADIKSVREFATVADSALAGCGGNASADLSTAALAAFTAADAAAVAAVATLTGVDLDLDDDSADDDDKQGSSIIALARRLGDLAVPDIRAIDWQDLADGVGFEWTGGLVWLQDLTNSASGMYRDGIYRPLRENAEREFAMREVAAYRWLVPATGRLLRTVYEEVGADFRRQTSEHLDRPAVLAEVAALANLSEQLAATQRHMGRPLSQASLISQAAQRRARAAEGVDDGIRR
ncbi:MAG: dynamin family protein [Fimbriimonadaceae bacterium]|nr:dynamin family protein [Fimbriimonadaceae bacterium]